MENVVLFHFGSFFLASPDEFVSLWLNNLDSHILFYFERTNHLCSKRWQPQHAVGVDEEGKLSTTTKHDIVSFYYVPFDRTPSSQKQRQNNNNDERSKKKIFLFDPKAFCYTVVSWQWNIVPKWHCVRWKWALH